MYRLSLRSQICLKGKPVPISSRWFTTRPPSRAFRLGQPPNRPTHTPWRKSRITMWASAQVALGTAAFVSLSETDNSGTEKTAEQRMLEVSREEIRKKVDDQEWGVARLRYEVVLFVDLYIWEPLCTGVRFLHLAAIFVPVILSVPALWLGSRQPDHDNERSGTLWWYGFLVKSMERAGPAFIKV